MARIKLAKTRSFAFWRRCFGSQNPEARERVARLFDRFEQNPPEIAKAYEQWRFVWRSTSGLVENASIPRNLRYQYQLWNLDPERLELDAFVFIMQTYVAQTILEIVQIFLDAADKEIDALFGPSAFDWGAFIRGGARLDDATLRQLLPSKGSDVDPFGNAYERFFSRELRKTLGEYYTPASIARYLYRKAAARLNDSKARFLDPTCGAGVFVTIAYRAALARSNVNSPISPIDALDLAAGADVSPFAVLTARANLLFALIDAMFQRDAASEDAASSPSRLAPTPRDRRRAILTRVITERLARGRRSILPIYLWDALRERAPFDAEFDLGASQVQDALLSERYDALLGNPPWIAWDKTSPEYRESIKDYWRRYGLFDLSAKDAIYGGSKKELASLLVCATVDRRLRDGGVFAFILPKSLFQKGKAGVSFRRFGDRIGKPFQVVSIDDFSDVDVFPTVLSRPAAMLAKKGAATKYPIELIKWTSKQDDLQEAPRDRARDMLILELNAQKKTSKKASNAKSSANAAPIDASANARSPLETLLANANAALPYLGQAVPTSQAPGASLAFETNVKFASANLGSPAVRQSGTSEQDRLVARLFDIERAASATRRAYKAQLGANAGGASGVFWFDARDVDLSGPLARVRNLHDSGKRKVESTEAQIESELLFPLLRWRDVAQYRTEPINTLVLIPQDPATRKGFELEIMENRYPCALEYLRKFETELRDRAAYKRYQRHAQFWSLYNVDVNTFAPYKVVWRRMDSLLRAAVVGPDEIRRRPVVPQETLSMFPVESLEEARYLCAVLNSEPMRILLGSIGAASTKSFGSPGMLDAAPIPRFDPQNDICQKLAEICPK